MSREGMADIILQVRQMAASGTAEYTLGTATFWDDDQIEQVLDRHRTDLVRHRIASEPSYIGSGSVTYTRHRSEWGNIEEGTAFFIIEDSVGDNRSTATYTADYRTGVIDFTSDQKGTALYLTARSYDIYAAAGELLEDWAAHESRCFDFNADGQSFRVSQKAQGLREQARLMRKRARVTKKRLRTG